MTENNYNGFILIDRGITKHWIWQDDKRLRWWLEFLIMASYEDQEVLHDSHKFVLKRGQIIASARYLANKWNTNEKTVTNFLKLLVENGMASREVLFRKTSVITICNYDKYQLRMGSNACRTTDPLTDPLMETLTDPLTDPLLETNKRNKRNISPKGESICARTCVEISPHEVVDAWNTICTSLPKVKVLHDKRKEKIKLRLKEMGSIEKVREVFLKIEASAYCTGNKGWKATFDWVMDNPSNWVKVIEGNYDNNQTTNKDNGTNDSKRGGAVAQSSSDFRLSF